jgi:hypothetical protein
MVKWVQKPDAKTAIMPEAIAQYGLMPELGFDSDSLKEMALFVYEKQF